MRKRRLLLKIPPVCSVWWPEQTKVMTRPERGTKSALRAGFLEEGDPELRLEGTQEGGFWKSKQHRQRAGGERENMAHGDGHFLDVR